MSDQDTIRILELLLVGMAAITWGLTMFFVSRMNSRQDNHGKRIGDLESLFNGNSKSDELRQSFLKDKLEGLADQMKSQSIEGKALGVEIKEVDRKITDFLITQGRDMSDLFRMLMTRMESPKS